MGLLAVKCPTTGKFYWTGIETDPETMIALPRDVQTQSYCPRCGHIHDWWARETILVNFLPK
jgi:hypothetical protein